MTKLSGFSTTEQVIEKYILEAYRVHWKEPWGQEFVATVEGYLALSGSAALQFRDSAVTRPDSVSENPALQKAAHKLVENRQWVLEHLSNASAEHLLEELEREGVSLHPTSQELGWVTLRH